MVRSTIRKPKQWGGSNGGDYNNRNRRGKRRLRGPRSRRPRPSDNAEAASSQAPTRVHEQAAGVPSGPRSLHQRALLGARARAAGPSGKAHEPRFVKPYRKSEKNDANDAEAICEAVARPSMRFVPIKSA